jgi:mannose/fructose/N-acetylgalactosamine-specific phosphotransferase system component IIB
VSVQPKSVALARVDNRLVHGQVLEAWLPALDAQGIVVADDEAAASLLVRSAMSLAIPPRISFQVLSIAQAAALFRPGGEGPPAPRTLLLVREVRDAAALREQGVPLPRLNLGNIHFRAGRKALSTSVYLDQAELDLLSQLAAAGTEIELRAVPSDAPIFLAQAKARFDLA